jgi:hypothetical protein
MADAPRRFPPPWRADKMLDGYVVREANGQAPLRSSQVRLRSNTRRRRITVTKPLLFCQEIMTKQSNDTSAPPVSGER